MRSRRSVSQLLINEQQTKEGESSQINGTKEDEEPILEEILDGRYITKEIEFLCKFSDSRNLRWIPRSQCADGFLMAQFFNRQAEQMRPEDGQAATENEENPSTSSANPDETDKTPMLKIGRCTTVVQPEESQSSTPSNNEDEEVECLSMKNSIDGFCYTFGHRNGNEKTVQISANQLSNQPNKNYMQQALSFALNRVFDVQVEFRDTGIVVHSSDTRKDFTAESLLHRLNENHLERNSANAQNKEVSRSSTKKGEDYDVFNRDLLLALQEEKEKMRVTEEKFRSTNRAKNDEERIQTKRRQTSLETPIKLQKLEEPNEKPVEEEKIQTRRSRTSIESPTKTLETPTENTVKEEKTQTRKSRTSIGTPIKALVEPQVLEVPIEEPAEDPIEEQLEESQSIPDVLSSADQAPRKRGRKPKSLLTLEASNIVDQQPSTSSDDSLNKTRPSARIRRNSTQNNDNALSALKPNSSSQQDLNVSQVVNSTNETSLEEPRPAKMPKLNDSIKDPPDTSKNEIETTTSSKKRYKLNLITYFNPKKKNLSGGLSKLLSKKKKYLPGGSSKLLLKKRKRGRPRLLVSNGTQDQQPASSNLQQTEDSSPSLNQKQEDNQLSTSSQKKTRGRPPKNPNELDSKQDDSLLPQKLPQTERLPITSSSETSSDKQEDNQSNSQQIQKRGRGRPPKDSTISNELDREDSPSSVNLQQRRRGRPPNKESSTSNEVASNKQEDNQSNSQQIQKRGRGRPPKDSTISNELDREDSPSSVNLQQRRRGRPPNKESSTSNDLDSKLDDSQSTCSSGSQKPRGRGRPPKAVSMENLTAKDLQQITKSVESKCLAILPIIKKRGRPRLTPETSLPTTSAQKPK